MNPLALNAKLDDIIADLAVADGNVDDIETNLAVVDGLVDKIMNRVAGQTKVHPTLADGIAVATHADAWTLGSFVEIIAAAGITTIYTVEGIYILDQSGVDEEWELVLYSGALAAEVEFGRVRGFGSHPAYIPLGKELAANVRVSAKSANKTAATAVNVIVAIAYRLNYV